MDFKIDAFPVDDTVNGIRSTEKIKILVCYILAGVKKPLSRAVIQSILYDNGIANYFEVSQAIDDLIKVGALDETQAEGDSVFTVNDNGRRIAKELESELSVFIKNKASRAAALTLIYEQRKKENDFKVTRINDKKFRLDITMRSGLTTDGEEDKLMSLSVYVTDGLQAESMKQCFINNPVRLYKSVIEALTTDAEFKE